MQQKIQNYIEKHQLLTLDAPIIVGVSGGADSVVLLHLLIKLGYSCIVAHCNFHLRMDESSRDEAFVRKLAYSLSIPYYNIDFETAKYASSHRISIEMAARDLRYSWFQELLTNHQAQAIAVAHHADDSIETLLMNLVRGTGLRGLTGISPFNEKVVRPLLCCTRLEIENYIRIEQLEHITDSSNASMDYQRNKFRNAVLPLLEEINPSVRQTLYDSVERFGGTLAIYQQAIDRIKNEIVHKSNETIKIDIELLKQQADIPTILYEILNEYGFNQSTIKQIVENLTAESGKQFYSPTHRLLKDRQYLIVSQDQKETNSEFWITNSNVHISHPICIKIKELCIGNDFIVSKDKNIVQLDAEKLKFPLQLRHWQEGDSFYPFGMTQRQKISDFFINNKFTLLEKEKCWLMLSGEEIVWILGCRVDNRFRVSENTKKIVQFAIT